MAKVYVAQIPTRVMFDPTTQQPIGRVPTYDISNAEEQGELFVCLPEGSLEHVSARRMVELLRTKLFDYGDDDCILPVGSMAASCATVACAAFANNGRVKILQWDKRARKYEVISFDFAPLRQSDSTDSASGRSAVSGRTGHRRN